MFQSKSSVLRIRRIPYLKFKYRMHFFIIYHQRGDIENNLMSVAETHTGIGYMEESIDSTWQMDKM